MSISLLRQLLMKEAVKKSAGSSGIMTINKNIAKANLNEACRNITLIGNDIKDSYLEQFKIICFINLPFSLSNKPTLYPLIFSSIV